MECEYCQKVFSTLGNLKTHQEKTKRCLSLQNKRPDIIYNCDHCQKEFLTRANYKRHLKKHEDKQVVKNIQEENLTQKQNIDNMVQENSALKKENSALKQEIQSKTNANNGLQLDYGRVMSENEKLQKENSALKQEIQAKTNANNGLQLDYGRVMSENEKLQRELKDVIDRERETLTKMAFSRMHDHNEMDEEHEQKPASIVQSLRNVQVDAKIAIDQNNLLQIASEMITAGEVKTTLEFVSTFMFALDSEEQFPLNIELLVERRVFDNKSNAKRSLLKYFTEDIDYKITKQKTLKIILEKNQGENKGENFATLEGVAKKKDSRGGHNSETITLTTECFKSLSQTAMNEVGRQTRLYYQDMEKILKKYIIIEYNNRIVQQNSEIKRINRNHNAILKKRTYFKFINEKDA